MGISRGVSLNTRKDIDTHRHHTHMHTCREPQQQCMTKPAQESPYGDSNDVSSHEQYGLCHPIATACTVWTHIHHNSAIDKHESYHDSAILYKCWVEFSQFLAVSTRTNLHTYTWTHVHKHTRTHAHICSNAQIHTHVTHTHKHISTDADACTYANRPA